LSKGRIEAFSDGVLAIIITIMVLELKVPHDGTLSALTPLIPKFLSYILSFIFLGIYWNNHHHLWQAAKEVNGMVLWANLHVLFWLSLIPFVTAWMGENNFSKLPVAFYGGVLWFSAMAYYLLTRALLILHGERSVLASALGKDIKGLASLYIYTAAIPLAIVDPRIALVLYIIVAIMWLVPDRRIENTLKR